MIQFSTYALICSMAVIIMAMLAWYVWGRRTALGSLYFSLLMLATVEWTLMNVLGTLVVDLPTRVLCSRLSYIGILSVAPLWLLFALYNSRRQKWLKWKYIGLIRVVPAITLALVMTNEWHGLIWPGISSIQTPEGVVVIYAHGIGVLIDSICSYVMIIAASAFILGTAIRQDDKNYFQKLFLVLGDILPLTGSMIYNLGMSPFKYQGITPVIFTLSGLIFAPACS